MPGLKTGVKNDTFWSEIGSGFKETVGTPSPIIPRSTPPPPSGMLEIFITYRSSNGSSRS